jgi:hypothetical protein
MTKITAAFLIIGLFSCTKERVVSTAANDNESQAPSEIALMESITIIAEEEPTVNVPALSRTDNLRVRTLPSIVYGEVINKLNNGDDFTVSYRTNFDEEFDGKSSCWYYKNSGAAFGWVWGGYIDINSEELRKIPVFKGSFNLDINKVTEYYNDICLEGRNSTDLPVTRYPALEIPKLGYVCINGIYFWVQNNTIYAFNGNKQYEFLNILLLDGLDWGYAILKYSDDAIYLTQILGGAARSNYYRGFILDIKNGTLIKDKTDEYELITQGIDSTMPNKNTVYIFEGFCTLIGNKLYGRFIDEEQGNTQSYIYSYENGKMNRLAIVPQKYIDYALRTFSSDQTIMLYYPVNGWKDEDTYGPYNIIEYNFITDETVRNFKLDNY